MEIYWCDMRLDKSKAASPGLSKLPKISRTASNPKIMSSNPGLPRMAKILKRRGNNIEAVRRGAVGNGHLGDAFSMSGQGRGLISLSLVVAF